MDNQYNFANAVFDPKRGALTVAGRTASLRPRTASVLQYLLDHPCEVVGKEDLLREVWSDLVVTENSLAQCVKEIRRELGDTRETLLKTVHRRGYVLETRVERMNAPPAPRRVSRSLMVLPLVNVGGDPDQDYFAEGLTEELTTDVGRMPGVIVISRGTAQSYAGRAVDARAIGRELGVGYLLEGTVRRDDSHIVVSLSVSDTQDARVLWTERFESPRANLGALQRSMAGKVSHMLHIEMLAIEAGWEAPADPDARDLVMRAWSLQYRASPGVSRESRAMILRALELDPKSAFIWSALAHSHVFDLATRHTDDWDATLAEADRAATRALELDPNLGKAYLALGQVRAYQGRLEEALEYLERQLALNPNNTSAHQWCGIVHMLTGNAQLAIRPLEVAIELSPRDRRLSTLIRNLALAHLHLRDDAQGLILAERSIHAPPPWPRSYETLAAAYAVSGLMDDARAAVKVLLEKWPGYSIAKHREEMMSNRPAFLAQRERLLEGLRQAGLPER